MFSTYFLSIIKIVPINIKTLDKTSMHIVNASPLLVVSSKKKIINRMLVKTKLDLSIGVTLLIFLKLIALKYHSQLQPVKIPEISKYIQFYIVRLGSS